MVSLWKSDADEAMEYLYRRAREKDAQGPGRKFLEGHQLIHDRRKYDPCIPFFPGHDQEAWFEKLDASQIWEKVFAYLTSPSDVTSAYFACEMFRKHLELKRKMMLLPKVFLVLRNKYVVSFDVLKKPMNVFKARHCDRRDGLDILNYRLVSKAWKKSAEEAFLFPPPPQPHWHPQSWNWYGQRVCTFRSLFDVNKALEKLRNPSTSASLLRMVEVADVCYNREEYHEKLGEFMDLHGGSVWGLKFGQSRFLGMEEFDCNAFRNLVSRMPQLKALNLDVHWQYPGRACLGVVSEEEVDERLKDLCRRSHAKSATIMMHSPFPEIPTLELCQVECSWNIQFNSSTTGNLVLLKDCLLSQILRKCTNVKGLGMDSFSSDGDGVVWECVQNLHLQYLHLGYGHGSGASKRDFQRLKELQSPLHTLRVGVKEEEVTVKAQDIFPVLNRLNDSLVEIKLDCKQKLLGPDPILVKDFPKLERIEFRVWSYQPINYGA